MSENETKLMQEIELLKSKVERLRGVLLYVRCRDKDYQARSIIDSALED